MTVTGLLPYSPALTRATSTQSIPEAVWTPSIEEYHRDSAIGSTMLRTLDRGGVAEYRARYVPPYRFPDGSESDLPADLVLRARKLLGRGGKDSKAMRIGAAAHCAILESHIYPQRFFVAQSTINGKIFDRRQRNEWQKLKEAHPNKVILTAEEHLAAAMICGSIFVGSKGEPESKTLARKVLSEGLTEYSYRWQTKEGLWCRVRFDALYELPDGRVIVLEVKCTYNPSAKSFASHFAYQGWDLQAAHYREGAEDLLGRPISDFWVVAIRSSYPYNLVIYRLKKSTLDKAQRRLRELRKELVRRYDTGDWMADEERKIQRL